MTSSCKFDFNDSGQVWQAPGLSQGVDLVWLLWFWPTITRLWCKLADSHMVQTQAAFCDPRHTLHISDTSSQPLTQWRHSLLFVILVGKTWEISNKNSQSHTRWRHSLPSEIVVKHYSDRWRLKSPAYRLFAQPFGQARIKENIKAPRHWPLWGESTGDWWIPLT